MRKSLSEFEYRTLVLGIFGIIVGIVTAWAIWRQVSIGSETLIEVRDSRRPWVGIDGTPTMRQDAEHWRIDFTVRNFGLSPALHAVPGGGAEDITSTESMKNSIERSCAMAEKLTTSGEDSNGPPSEGHGYTLFPGSPLPQTLSAEDNPVRSIYLLGCIAYLDQFGKRPIHHTRYCYYARLPLTDGEKLVPCFGGQNAN